MDWYIFVRLQRGYPEPGMQCVFGEEELSCIVVSNCFGNRAVVLQCQDKEWGGAFLILTYCWMPWRPWPTLVMGLIDDPQDGRLTRGYVLNHGELSGRQWRGCSEMAGCYMSLLKFDALEATWKSQWFLHPDACLQTADWRQAAARMDRSASSIQTQWRRSIASPSYSLCIRRLLREYNALSHWHASTGSRSGSGAPRRRGRQSGASLQGCGME